MKLKQAYRLHTLQAALHEGDIKRVFTLLRAAGVEPLLAKGWAVARLYPESGLRPYGDIDLCVRPDEYQAAVDALAAPGIRRAPVDLHQRFSDLKDRALDELYRRSHLVRLGDVDVRILGPEDHLRLLCLHLLRHGARRALWLCDIGAVLESMPEDLEWDYLVSGDRRRSDWVACVIGVAHQLLDSRLDESPVAERARHLPGWLVPTVLHQWGMGYSYYTRASECYLRNPAGVLQGLRERWPNPVEATTYVHGPFNGLPRLPFQVTHYLMHLVRFPVRVSGFTRKHHLSSRKTRETVLR